MTKKTINKNVNMAKEEKAKDTALDTENTENTILDVEKTENIENISLDTEKDEDTENTILDVEKKDSDIIRKALEEDASKEDEQTPTITSEEKVENEDSHPDKKNSANKVNKTKRKISKLFGYYWNGQMMD